MRRYSFILALLTVFLLKLRMSGVMIEFLNPEYDFTVIYGVSYLLTLLGILDLTIYYIIIRKRNPFKRWVTVVFMVIAMVFFVAGLVLEGILLFKYNIGMEPNKLCTLITRPIFYLSFVGLCVYFLFPPPPNEFDRIYLTSYRVITPLFISAQRMITLFNIPVQRMITPLYISVRRMIIPFLSVCLYQISTPPFPRRPTKFSESVESSSPPMSMKSSSGRFAVLLRPPRTLFI